ncbi:MAG TPA: hypothetical protein DEV74_13195 [Acidovorax sp.]|nr:hypothetical protein [Acidovorax sp.]
MKQNPPPERLLRFPPLSQCCALRAVGRRQRTQAKRRLGSGAALARRPLAWSAPVVQTPESMQPRVY